MLVQQVADFYNSFMAKDLLSESDAGLLQSITSHFSERSMDEMVNEQDMQLLRQHFKDRWLEIQGKQELDYTLADNKANRVWIDFAKLVASELKISYLSILFPNLANAKESATLKDPADGSSLEETTTLTNFYIGDDNTLRRKRVLFDRMKKHDFTLCTSTDPTGKHLKIISVSELSRLRRCQNNVGAFGIKISSTFVEEFSCFWDFISKKSFPKLTKRGKIPVGLFPHLVELVEYYYHLKRKNGDFNKFKDVAKSFFGRLQDYHLENVNFLYGQKVQYNEQPHYLVELFISIFEATDFVLEHELEALSIFLFEINHNLKASSIELSSLYEKLEKLTNKEKEEQAKAHNQCCSLLVSLYVHAFKMQIFTGVSSINDWDMENTLPTELYPIYKLLKGYLVASNANFVDAYTSILNTHIIPKSKEQGFFSWLTRNEATGKWLLAVKERRLSTVSGYWFDPELIFSALLAYNTTKIENRKCVHEFLDDFIQTIYNKKGDAFQKELRVNILFARFLSDLEAHKRKHLLMLLATSNVEEAKSHFLHNCESYIDERLKVIGYVEPPLSSPRFFIPIKPIDTSSEVQPQMTSLYALLEQYKKLSFTHLDEEVKLKIHEYLYMKLSYPILSLEEERNIESDQRPTKDPIGAYT